MVPFVSLRYYEIQLKGKEGMFVGSHNLTSYASTMYPFLLRHNMNCPCKDQGISNV